MGNDVKENLETGQYNPQAPKNRRVKMLMVNPPDFMALFKKGLKIRASFKVVEGVPEDAKLLYVGYDHMRGAVVMIVESETFDEVPLSTVPPPIPVSIMVGGFTKKKAKK